MANMKILMLGGRRCGKTSILAAMIDQMKNGEINKYFAVCDQTTRSTKTIEGKVVQQDLLNDKIIELKAFLATQNNSVRVIDEGPTSTDWTYTLSLQKTGDGALENLTIDFYDVPGEACVKGTTHFNNALNIIQTGCDAIIVVVDTPYMMEAPDYVAEGANAVTGVHDLLVNIQDPDNPKMIVFVPVKCEKWYKDGKIDEVTQKTQELYHSSIIHLTAPQTNNTVCIMPVQTAGNILFQELREAECIVLSEPADKQKYKNLIKKNRDTDNTDAIKCTSINDETVRLENGRLHIIKENDFVDMDPRARITTSHPPVLRPYAWYIIDPDNNGFEPKNCDQLPIHILLFLLKKIDAANAKVSQLKGGGTFFQLINKLIAIIRRIMASFGRMGEDKVRAVISSIQNAGLVKDNVEGIKYLKKTH